jgi:phosphotransferase system IIB component
MFQHIFKRIFTNSYIPNIENISKDITQMTRLYFTVKTTEGLDNELLHNENHVASNTGATFSENRELKKKMKTAWEERKGIMCM